LKGIYKPLITKKLGLGTNFLRYLLYVRKSVIRVGLLQPKTILAMLVLKLYIESKRMQNNVSQRK